jgi:hypothetical protein
VTLGTVDGLISCLFVFAPGIITLIGIRYLCRKGFFGPHQ